jgi:hypothetical protein
MCFFQDEEIYRKAKAVHEDMETYPELRPTHKVYEMTPKES